MRHTVRRVELPYWALPVRKHCYDRKTYINQKQTKMGAEKKRCWCNLNKIMTDELAAP